MHESSVRQCIVAALSPLFFHLSVCLSSCLFVCLSLCPVLRKRTLSTWCAGSLQLHHQTMLLLFFLLLLLLPSVPICCCYFAYCYSSHSCCSWHACCCNMLGPIVDLASWLPIKVTRCLSVCFGLSSPVNRFCCHVQNRTAVKLPTKNQPPTHTQTHTCVCPSQSPSASDTCSFIVISNLFRLTFIVHLGFICNTLTHKHTHTRTCIYMAHPVCCPSCGRPFPPTSRCPLRFIG